MNDHGVFGFLISSLYQFSLVLVSVLRFHRFLHFSLFFCLLAFLDGDDVISSFIYVHNDGNVFLQVFHVGLPIVAGVSVFYVKPVLVFRTKVV